MVFDDPGLLKILKNADDASLNRAPFGIVAMALDTVVEAYNQEESQQSGLSPSRVIGRPFFSRVAPCMNNYMVSHRFETEPEIDSVIDYVFTLRMRPTPVRLRLLKHPDLVRMYLLIERR